MARYAMLIADASGKQKISVVLPCPVEALPAIPFRQFNGGRPRKQSGPSRIELMILLGLSPLSMWPRCDLCGHTPSYLAKHGIQPSDPVMCYGRYAAHEFCYQRDGQDLATMHAEPLDYRIVVVPDGHNSASMLMHRMMAKIQRAIRT